MNKKIIPIIVVDFQRALYSKKFLIAVLGYAFLLCINIPTSIWPNDFYYVFSYAYKPGFYMFFPLCASIPYASSHIEEVSNGYIKNLVRRVELKRYSFSRCVAVGVSGFLAVILATGIFLIYLRIRFPYVAEVTVDYSGWDELIKKGYGVEYMLVKTVMTALCGSALAQVALALSVEVKNTCFVFAFPTLLYYAWNELTYLLNIPLAFDWLSLLNVPLFSSYLVSFEYFCMIMGVISVAAGVLFYFSIRRRIYHGYY